MNKDNKKSKLVDFNFYNQTGIIYKYDDIESVETGFYRNKIGFLRNQSGNFYYKVNFKDGKKINFHDSISRYEDTYTDYVVFDKLIMAKGVTKTSSTENVKYSSLGEVYINRLCDVINNKN